MVESTSPPVAARAKPWRRAPEELAAGLGAWARVALSPAAELGAVVAPANGMSSETVLFDVDVDGRVEPLVARMAPLPSVVPVFEDYDLAMQARLMALLAEHTAVPVPTVRSVVLDDGFLGVPFLVMDRAAGQAPSDNPPYLFGGWVVDLGREGQAVMQRNAIRVLAHVHQLTPAVADLSFLGPGALADHLERQRGYYEWARGEVTVPLVERLLAWLAANEPTPTGPPVLTWGDARIGNILWEGSTPVAVLDWEMALVGPPELDLGWMVTQHHFFQSMAPRAGVPGLPDFLRRDDVATTYTELAGRPVEHLEWFEVFAALRLATVSVRSKLRDVAYGLATIPDDPDDLVAFRPILETMLTGAYWEISKT